MRSPRPADRVSPEDPDRARAAARRLAMLAADLGSAPPSEQDEEWWADHTRVAERRPVAEPTRPPPPRPISPSAEVEAPLLPRPGRHAARRRLSWRLDRLPALGVAHVAVLAVAIAVAVAGTAWWLVRDRAEPAEPLPPAGTAAPLVAASGSTASAAAGDAGDQAGAVTVDVAGKVRRPGIVVLDAGARVVDALKAAGGVRRGVDTSGLNLARVLVDGEQIVVGAAAAAPGAPPPGGASPAVPGAPAAPVNLNLADQATLEALPQVGPVTAAAIIAWRDEHGGFSSVDELLEVDGIGEKTLAQLAPLVTV